MNVMKTQFCWLVQKEIPVSEWSPFTVHRADVTIFQSLYLLSFPNFEFCQQEIYALKSEYFAALESEEVVSLRERLCPRFEKDLLRTLGVLRTAEGLEKHPDDDPVFECLSRILLFAELRGVEYRQCFAELAIPIYHMSFCGISGISSMPPDLQLVEAITAQLFIRFMICPPFDHIKLFDQSFIQEKIAELSERLKRYEIGEIIEKENVNVALFASKWMILVFMQDVHFADVLTVWKGVIKRLAEPNGDDYFSILIDCCESVAVSMTSKCRGKTSIQVLKTLQQEAYTISESAVKRRRDQAPQPARRGRK